MSQVRSYNNMVLSEVLDTINKDPSLLQPGKPFAFQNRTSALAQVFYYGYVRAAKFLLPDGEPPYNKEERKPGTTSSDLLFVIRKNRFSYFVNPNIDQRKREQMFIMLLETVCTDEAEVLLMIKDQTLDQKYCNLTYDVLEAAGYLPARTEQEKAEANSKSSQAQPTVEVSVEPQPVAETTEQDSQHRRRGRPKGTTKKVLEARRAAQQMDDDHTS